MRPYYERDGFVIYNADCRDVLPTLTGDAIITDPPYGVGRRYGEHYDDDPATYWDWFVPCVSLMRQTAPVVAMTHRLEALRKLADWDWVACWHKPVGASARIGNSPILPHWEPILLWGIYTLGTKREALPDVITASAERSPVSRKRKVGHKIVSRAGYNRLVDLDGNHPLPKPILLFRRLVRGLTDRGGACHRPVYGFGNDAQGREGHWPESYRHRDRRAVVRGRGEALGPGGPH